MNRLAEIEAFIAVVDAGSQLAAAEKMNIAVSAIHRRIKALETRLGVALTHRTPQGTALTQYGRSYYQRCLRVVADLNEADAQIAGELHDVAGLIRIAIPHAIGVKRIAPCMNRFAAENPDIRFEIDVSDRHVDLVEEQFDLAIRIDRLERSQLEEEILFKVQYAVCASPAFWQEHGHPNTPEDLIGLPMLTYQTSTDSNHWQFRDSAGKLSKVPLTSRYFANNGEFLIAAAKDGLGVALEPSFVCGEALRSGELVSVLEDYQTYERFAKIVHPSNRPLSFRVEEFLKVLRTVSFQ